MTARINLTAVWKSSGNYTMRYDNVSRCFNTTTQVEFQPSRPPIGSISQSHWVWNLHEQGEVVRVQQGGSKVTEPNFTVTP